MNYYDEMLKNVENLINQGELDEAYDIVSNELKMPYIPRDIEDRLNKYMSELKTSKIALKSLTDDDIIKYLKDNDPQKQLIAVNELDRRDIRSFIDICDEFLKSKSGYINAKALLIDSLIRQEVNYRFTYINDSSLIEFNPRELKPIEEMDGFKRAIYLIQENYIKDPSKAKIGVELAYKEALLSLPNEINGEDVAKKIIQYIDEAFDSAK